MKKLTLISALAVSLILVFTGCSSNSGESQATDSSAERTFNYYTAEQTKDAIENAEDVILLDIQVEEEWEAHHIKGAIPTHAYPVKTDEEKAKLDVVIDDLQGDQPIIVICPGGAGGATRTVEYLETKGIAPERLFILENGQSKWPYEDLLEK